MSTYFDTSRRNQDVIKTQLTLLAAPSQASKKPSPKTSSHVLPERPKPAPPTTTTATTTSPLHLPGRSFPQCLQHVLAASRTHLPHVAPRSIAPHSLRAWSSDNGAATTTRSPTATAPTGNRFRRCHPDRSTMGGNAGHTQGSGDECDE